MFITYGQWFLSLCLTIILLGPSYSDPRSNDLFKRMEAFTKRQGQSFFEFSNAVTKFDELRDSFSRSADSIQQINIQNLFSRLMRRVNESLQGRVKAIQNLAEYAEPKAYDFYTAKPVIIPKEPIDPKEPEKIWQLPKSYYNSKLLNKPETKDTDTEEVDIEDLTKFNCTFDTGLPLSHNEHFQGQVNMNVSSVHVPTSIYACDPPLLDALAWSSDLEVPFIDNYKRNPTLGWQYFGSSTGFLRQYPAMKWPNDNSDPDAPDLYDCRFRPWYTASASSPKNLLILLDTSGSMTGLRRRIAKAVVNSILDTLTDNDYVNVFNFSETTQVSVECTNDTGTPVLVQATLENLRDLRVAMEQTLTEEVANFSLALIKAFETLRYNQDQIESSQCNQAVMIVTDGAPDKFEKFFEENNKNKRVRVFTYLVGREVTDKNEVEEMACNNQGYFTHVATLGEVQEQVVKYIHVMSRPLVLSQKRDISWTNVYANHAELVESEWQWEEQIKERQKERASRYKWFYHNVAENNDKKKKDANKSAIFAFTDGGKKKDDKNLVFVLALHKLKNYLDYETTNISARNIRRMEAEKERMVRILQDNREGGPNSSFITKLKSNLHNRMLLERNRQLFKDFEFRKFDFIVSCSFPVFDIRNHTNSSSSSKKRIPNFLGVVGTDISIEEIKNLASPFELGVNAYAFAITNNGHVIFHPDFRPLYENILKPSYNTVDLTDVELVDSDATKRNNDEDLLQMRKEMIDKNDPNPSEPKLFSIRVHHDGFKRVSIRNHVYVFGKIPSTVYTLAIQVPQNSTTYQGETEVSRHWKDKAVNIVRSYFDSNISFTDEDGTIKMLDRNWRIHPDWSYCHYLSPVKPTFPQTKEDTLVHFIKRIQSASSTNKTWQWGTPTMGYIEKEGDQYVCNKKLVQSVVFDAMITKPFSDTSEILQEPKLRSIVASFGAELLSEGVLTTIMATRSGLTRWVNHPMNRAKPDDLPFTEYHPRTVEESWYQRSVDRTAIEEDSYVVSVPFDAGTRNYSRVTVTRAMLASREGRKAPVAVAGVQYDLDKFLSFFGVGSEARLDERNICQNEDFQCFILDENAFVIGSSQIGDDAGQFFGEIDRHAMESLIESNIYKEVRVVDFQGTCFQDIIKTSPANVLLTPFRKISLAFNWFLTWLTSFLLRLNFPTIVNFPLVLMDSSDLDDDDDDTAGDRNMPFVAHASVNKTKLRPCDFEYKLFTYGSAYNAGRRTLDRRPRVLCGESCQDYLNVQRIPHTNLVIVIVEAKCRCGARGGYKNRRTIKGEEVQYPLYRKFENRTESNPVLLELCKIPQRPLYRKRIKPCYSYAKAELDLKEDCGRAISLQLSWLLVLATTVTSFRAATSASA